MLIKLDLGNICLLTIIFDLVIIFDLLIFDLGNIAGVAVKARMYVASTCIIHVAGTCRSNIPGQI
jgi:hypothetical protein